MPRRAVGLAFFVVLSLACAAPASAGALGGGSHGVFSGSHGVVSLSHGVFHGSHGVFNAGGVRRGSSFHSGSFLHRGSSFHSGTFFHRSQGFSGFGCCAGPAVVLGAEDAESPAAAYAQLPAAEPDPPAAPASPIFCYVGGCYHLQGDGAGVRHQWVWVPTPAAMPPPPPSAPPLR